MPVMRIAHLDWSRTNRPPIVPSVLPAHQPLGEREKISVPAPSRGTGLGRRGGAAALRSAALTTPALGNLDEESLGIVDIVLPGGREFRGVAPRPLRRIQLVENQAHRDGYALADSDRFGITQ